MNTKEKINGKQEVGKKHIEAVQVWGLVNVAAIIFSSLVLTIYVQMLIEILDDTDVIKDFEGLFVLVPFLVIIAIAGPIIVRWGKSEQRVRVALILQGVNAVIILLNFCALMSRVGSHWNTCEEYTRNFFIVIGITQVLTLLMTYPEYKKYEQAKSIQNLKEQDE